MTFDQLLKKIESRADVPAKEVSFERVLRASRGLDVEWPHAGRGVILIAGTNGKGTVAKTLETLLLARGENVGLFTSPHLMTTTERIRTSGRQLTEDEFIRAFSHVSDVVVEFGLSHFEILTLMMIEVFFGGRIRPRVTRAVIEVGVGGKWDPTRLVPHDTTVITRLGLDHQSLLGNTIQEIAEQKFGAIDEGNLVVHAPLPEGVLRGGRGRWIEATLYPYRVDPRGPRWILETPWGDAPLAIPGARAAENVSVALSVLAAQGEDLAPLLPSVSDAHWPGRMEKFEFDGRRVYLSGDHNRQGAESLSEILTHFHYDDLYLVIGVAKNKSSAEILEVLSRLPARGRVRIVLTKTPFRSSDLEAYGEWLSRAEIAVEDPVRALHFAIDRAKTSDLILVTGSLYLVGDLRRYITTRK